MVLPAFVISNQGIGLSSDAIFIFKESHIVPAVMPFLKIVKNTEKPL